MKSKKVLVLATSRKTRGGITSVLSAYEHLPFWEKYEVHWLETHIDRGLAWKLFYAFIALLKYLFIVWRYDIVHIHTSELPSVKRKYIFFKIAKALKKKVVVHLHIGNQLAEVAGNQLYCNLFNGADAILVLSQSIRLRLEQSFGVCEKVYVLYNPCPKIESPCYSDVNKEIIFAGTLNKNKGYDVLIQAFAKIALDFPKWKLIIAGNGELEQAQKIASECNVKKQVEFLGWVKGVDKENLFRRASVFCLASYAEGFPMAVLDAWSYAIPVIATPVGGLPDVLVDNKNVLFFKPGNIDELAEKLRLMLTDRNLRYTLSRESLSLSEGLFSENKINEQIDLLYKSL